MYVHGDCLQLNLKDEAWKQEGYINFLKEELKNPVNQKTDVHIHSSQSTNCLRDVASFAQRLSIGMQKDFINMNIKHGTVFPLLKQLRIGKNVSNGIFFQRSLYPKLTCLQLQGKAVEQSLMRTDQRIQSLKFLILSNFKIDDHESLKKLFQNMSKIKTWRIAIVDAIFPKQSNLKNLNTQFPELRQLRIWNVQNCNQIYINAPHLYCLQMNSIFFNIQFFKALPIVLLETSSKNKQILKDMKFLYDIRFYQD